jgi:cell division protease FtsH
MFLPIVKAAFFIPLLLSGLHAHADSTNSQPSLNVSIPLSLNSSDSDNLDMYMLKNFDAFLGNGKFNFDDIIGGVPQDIKDLKEFLEDAEYFRKAGAVMPRGYIFYGPPGTGKTLLAKALAGEVDAAFFAESGSSFTKPYMGEAVQKVKDTFWKAQHAIKYEGRKFAIIFIDELDSIGRRSGDDSAAAQENNRVINEFLAQMDGFDRNDTIIVIGATNRLTMLDEALLRPGRFEYHIEIGLPDVPKREALLRHYSSEQFHRRVAADVNFAQLAEKTAGFNCADIASLVNRAAIYVARKKKSVISKEAFEVSLAQFKK